MNNEKKYLLIKNVLHLLAAKDIKLNTISNKDQT